MSFHSITSLQKRLCCFFPHLVSNGTGRVVFFKKCHGKEGVGKHVLKECLWSWPERNKNWFFWAWMFTIFCLLIYYIWHSSWPTMLYEFSSYLIIRTINDDIETYQTYAYAWLHHYGYGSLRGCNVCLKIRLCDTLRHIPLSHDDSMTGSPLHLHFPDYSETQIRYWNAVVQVRYAQTWSTIFDVLIKVTEQVCIWTTVPADSL